MKNLMTVCSIVCVCTLSACDALRTPLPGVEDSPETNVTNENAGDPETPAPAENNGANEKQGILGKTTAEIVDAKKAMAENPDLKVMETSNLGGDPLTQSANAAVYIPSRILMLNMQNTLKQFRALNDRWPNYAEFMEIVKQNNIQFNMLKRWQMYGYDAEKGEMMILQDEGMKKEIYEKAGLDYVPGKL